LHYKIPAILIIPSEGENRIFDGPDDHDWFKFEANGNTNYQFLLEYLTEGLNANITIYDTDGVNVSATTKNGEESSENP
jgi:hypothetical protein